MKNLLSSPPTVTALERLLDGSDTPQWWCALIAGYSGTVLPERETGDRVLVRFRFDGLVAVNAAEIEWEVDSHLGWIHGIGAWRSRNGGECLAATRVPRIRAQAGDLVTVPAGALRLPAAELGG